MEWGSGWRGTGPTGGPATITQGKRIGDRGGWWRVCVCVHTHTFHQTKKTIRSLFGLKQFSWCCAPAIRSTLRVRR